MPPMRLMQRRHLLTVARDAAAPRIAIAIQPLLMRQYKAVSRDLRQANLRKRLKKADGVYDYGDDWGSWADEFGTALSGALEGEVRPITAVESAFWRSRGEPGPTFVPADVIDSYQTSIGRKITSISDTTLKGVQQTVADWYKTDEGLPALIDELETWFGEYRASMIAATEMGFVASEVATETMQFFDLTSWYWDAFDDQFTCKDCADLGAAHELLSIDDDKPPLHPNCRCGMLFANDDGTVVKSLGPFQLQKLFFVSDGRIKFNRERAELELLKYSPDQERDWHGRFGTSGEVKIDISEAGKHDTWLKALGEPLPQEDRGYYYHAGFAKDIGSIKEKGLIPTNSNNFPGYSSGKLVSLAPTVEDAAYWSETAFWRDFDKSGHISAKIPVFFRIAKDVVKDPINYRSDEIRTSSIAPENIEIWRDSKWNSLSSEAK